MTSQQAGRPGDQDAAARCGRAGRLCAWLIQSAALPSRDRFANGLIVRALPLIVKVNSRARELRS